MKIRALVGDRELDVTVVRSDGTFVVNVDGHDHTVDARKLEGDFYSFIVDGRSYEISVASDGDSYAVRHGASEQMIALAEAGRRTRDLKGGLDGPAQVLSVMPGKVVRVLVGEGDAVESGQGLIVVEAMKMENEIGSPKAGSVQTIHVEAGRTVEAGETLIVIE
jgi:biotin carboxyl carrier protein